MVFEEIIVKLYKNEIPSLYNEYMITDFQSRFFVFFTKKFVKKATFDFIVK